MQVQTPVIRLIVPTTAFFVVAYEHFGHGQAGRIFADLHTGARQLTIIGSCQKIGIEFIRDMRHGNNDTQLPVLPNI